MYINTFKYKPEDVSCVLCTEYVKKLGCTALSCPCLAERMEAGTVGYAEAVAELFPYRPRLTARIMRLAESFPGTMWQDDAHRKRMETLRLLLGCRKERDTPEFFAALYLLTSSKELADRTFNCFFCGGIDFRYARRRGISSHDYTLLMAAKSLYCHTAEVTQGDLAEPQIIPDEAFRLLINALLIARFGLDALKITASAGRYAPRLYCLFDLVVLAVVGLSGGADEAQVRPCDAAACRPDGRAADHAPCAVFLGGKSLPQRGNQLPAVGVLIVFYHAVRKFFNGNIGGHISPPF